MFRYAQTLGLAIGLSACGQQAVDAGSGPKHPFVGRYLWHIDNCESGTTTPIAHDTGSAVLGSRNSTSSFKLSIGQATLTVSSAAGDQSWLWLRDLDCTAADAIPNCPALQCMLDNDEDLFVAIGRVGDSKRVTDPLWLATDAPWPGYESCQSSQSVLNAHADAIGSCSDAGH